VAKVKPGQHSLVIPLGAKAKVSLTDQALQNLAAGKYTLKLVDISGASWAQEVTKR
jgi:thiosulfate dehydrogenase [quinone] large subunit